MKKVVYTSTNGVNIHYLKIEGDRVVRYLVVGHDSFAGTTSFNSRIKNLTWDFMSQIRTINQTAFQLEQRRCL